jgi:hypothetical protein
MLIVVVSGTRWNPKRIDTLKFIWPAPWLTMVNTLPTIAVLGVGKDQLHTCVVVLIMIESVTKTA